MKSWIAKQLTSIDMFLISFYIKSSEKTWFYNPHDFSSNDRKINIDILLYEIKLRGKKKHIIMFAKYLETYRYGRKLFCNSPLHTNGIGMFWTRGHNSFTRTINSNSVVRAAFLPKPPHTHTTAQQPPNSAYFLPGKGIVAPILYLPS